MDGTLAVEAEGVRRRYGRRWALVDVSLRARRGTLTMLTGRNGSGKSTLLRILASVIRADGGSVRIEGRDARLEASEVRRRVTLLAHHAYTYEALTALQNLEVAARFLGPPVRAELLARLDRVGLGDRADDAVETFSAGMRKRLSLARALLAPASVVLLDEPYGNLDPPGFALVDELLLALRRDGATVLVATHLLERGAELCDEALVLEAGRVAWSGGARELLRRGGAAAAGPVEGA
jgi:ABC-type multidrug transport system ATPase subunit